MIECMSDENYNSIPNFESLLSQRIQSNMHIPNNGNFNPYELMKKRYNGEQPLPQIQQWPEEDIKALEDYCKQRGLIGFNCGRLSPKIALRMLKSKMGDFDNASIENRIPIGYQKIGGGSNIGKDLLCG